MNKTILKILYDVLIILTAILLILALRTGQIEIVLIAYIVLAVGNIRKWFLNQDMESENVRE